MCGICITCVVLSSAYTGRPNIGLDSKCLLKLTMFAFMATPILFVPLPIQVKSNIIDYLLTPCRLRVVSSLFANNMHNVIEI